MARRFKHELQQGDSCVVFLLDQSSGAVWVKFLEA